MPQAFGRWVPLVVAVHTPLPIAGCFCGSSPDGICPQEHGDRGWGGLRGSHPGRLGAGVHRCWAGEQKHMDRLYIVLVFVAHSSYTCNQVCKSVTAYTPAVTERDSTPEMLT